MRPLERPNSDLRARLLAAAGRTPSTRPGAWRRRLIGAGLFTLAWTLTAAVALRGRSDWAELPTEALGQTFVALLVVALTAAVVAMTRGRTMIGAPPERLAAVVIGGFGVLLALVLAVDPHGASTPIFMGDDRWRHAGPCALIVVVLGLPLLVAGLVPFAGLTLGRPGLTGACVGLAAATLGHALIRFHCPLGGAPHALIGHLLPGIPMMCLGAWLSRARVVERVGARFSRSGEEKP